MADIIEIKGNVRYKITLDPSVWIFDERIVDLDTYFSNPDSQEKQEDDEKKFAASWAREVTGRCHATGCKKKKNKIC